MRLSEGVAIECSYTQLVEMTVAHYDFVMLACNKITCMSTINY